MLSNIKHSLTFTPHILSKTIRLFACTGKIVVSRSRMSSDTANSQDHQCAPGLLKIFESNQKRLSRINFLGQLYKAAGFELRIAGGAVRDILTGVEPKDIDFATTARPEDSLNILGKHEDIFRIIVTTAGQKHGTVAVKFKEQKVDLKRIKLDSDVPVKGDESTINKPEYDDESPFEITTLRCDTVTDGRHAEVNFVMDWKVDAERRDLTINAMFLTLDGGKLIDYFNGEEDLKEGRVRFVGDAELRVKEDYLRILRFFRFWNRYSKGNPPDDNTTEIIQKNLVGLDKISGERIWQELKNMFRYLPCAKMVDLMLKVKLIKFIGIDNIDDYEKYTCFVRSQIMVVEENILAFINRLESGAKPEIYNDKKIIDLKSTILFSSMIETSNMCLNAWKRLKFSNLERDVMLYIAEHRNEDLNIKLMMRQLALSHGPDRGQLKTKMTTMMIYKGEFEKLEEINTWTIPSFPINGTFIAHEIRKRKLPGQNIKVVLEYLKNQWADSDYMLTCTELEDSMNSKLDEILRTLKT